MEHHSSHSIGELLVSYLRESGLEKPLLESKVVEVFPQVLGETVARYVTDIEVTDGMLRCHVKNAALRQQLFENRFQLVEKLNNAVHAPVIRDIRLLG